ncbi:hypothetical protein BDR04DRAFT_496515 [Suillus decipiens]|nr:hypothetical protein BDR04DRAFT_496515 [Suillus decipiens]
MRMKAGRHMRCSRPFRDPLPDSSEFPFYIARRRYRLGNTKYDIHSNFETRTACLTTISHLHLSLLCSKSCLQLTWQPDIGTAMGNLQPPGCPCRLTYYVRRAGNS